MSEQSTHDTAVRLCRRRARQTLLMCGAIFVALALISTVLLQAVFAAMLDVEVPPGPFSWDASVDPRVVALTLGSTILWLPLLWLASMIAKCRPFGRFSSVEGRLRWSWLVRCVIIALVVYAAGYALVWVVDPPGVDANGLSFDIDRRTVLLVALILFLVPFQAAAEEYVFRGWAMRVVGSWLRHPIGPILLPAPLFALAHGYGVWGVISVASFAIVAGYLVWRTGGLEAAIAVHAIHNIFVLLGLIMTPSNPIGSAEAAGGTATSTLVVLLFVGIYVCWVNASPKRPGVGGAVGGSADVHRD